MPGVRGELQLIERAVKRWGLEGSQKTKALERVLHVLENSQDERAILRAASVLVTMEAQNQRDEHLASGVDELRNRIIELAARAGIDSSVLGTSEAIEDRTGSGDR